MTGGNQPTERRSPFRALRVRNYRLFFIGQVASIIGMWTQNVAVAWLVVEQTDSPTALGVVIALQFLPLLVIGAWTGTIADRSDKRRLLQLSNAAMAAAALATALLVSAGQGSVVTLGIMSLLIGVGSAFEMPARQSFAAEMVEPNDLPSAIGLNGATMTGSRVVGSAIAGVLLVTLGAPVCLYVNAASFAAVIVALGVMRESELRVVPPLARAKHQVRDGIRYAMRNADVRFPLVAMAVVGTLTLNNQVTTPLLAKITFDAGPALFAIFGVAGGSGAFVGAIVAAGRRQVTVAMIGRAALLGGLFTLGVSLSAWAWMALPLMACSAFCASMYISSTNARLQQTAEPAYRGRVMSLYSILFLGSTPIGSIIVSSVADVTNPRVAIAVGGVAALATGVVALARYSTPAPVSAPAAS